MASEILQAIGHFIMETIGAGGYASVVFLMAVESANIPLPSEVIMPFAGFLVSQGELNLWWTGLAGGLGCTIGSAFSWWLGAWGGKPLVYRYGKYVLLSKHDVERGEEWFRRHGNAVAFVSRLLPVVRTFISFPAGIAKVNLPLFLLYTFAGSVIWSTGLAFVGMKLGENWENLRTYFHDLDAVILLVILLTAVWWVWRHVKKA